ncbi:MAG TPA: hypothetical protein VFM07_03495 [Intrasporangium sp.]|nr:hypothetical protein [Intrasporangium sp.]
MNEHREGSRSQLGLLLDEVVADLPEVDFTATAWRGAQHRRRLRAALAAVVAAVLALGASWQWLGSHGVDRGMQPVPARTAQASVPIRIPTLPVPGRTAALPQPAPWVDQQGSVPDVHGARRIRMPSPERYGDLPVFNAGDNPLLDGVPDSYLSERPLDLHLPPVIAVYLKGDTPHGPSSTYQPVILVGGDLVTVDLVTLSAEEAERVITADAATLSADASELVFAKDGRVVIVDLVTHAVHSIAVPDRDLTFAGWAVDDPGAVIVHSRRARWHIDLATGLVRPAAAGENDSRFAARTAQRGAQAVLVLDRFDRGGVSSTDLGVGLGSPMSAAKSASGRVAIGTARTSPADSMVIADTRHRDAGGHPALKLLSNDLGFPIGPLGWDTTGRYLYFWAFAGGADYVLVCDVDTGGFYKALRIAGGPMTLPIAFGNGYARN